jgi:hypothetical protein
LRDVRHNVRLHNKQKKNPLKNKAMMQKLNPFAAKAATLKIAKKAKDVKQKRKDANAKKHKRDKTYNALQTGLKESF